VVAGAYQKNNTSWENTGGFIPVCHINDRLMTFTFFIGRWFIKTVLSSLGFSHSPKGELPFARPMDAPLLVVKICPENQASHYWGVTMDCIFHQKWSALFHTFFGLNLYLEVQFAVISGFMVHHSCRDPISLMFVKVP
jgi:hypothetical protein